MINYYLITKPGIIMGNLITLAAGFILASKHDHLNFPLFFATLAGLMFVIAAACVFNNYIDKELDKKMERTKKRVMVQGLISPFSALFFGTVLYGVGNFVLFRYTNLLSLIIANIGFCIYVFLYSMWKARTIYGTAIGSIAGAVPPVVGYVAASNQFDFGALILFTMLVFWQMPHFFSIAMLHYEDYQAAEVPVLPVKKGIPFTKVRMVQYIVAFILVSLLLTICGYTGFLYLAVTGLLGLLWLGCCIKGFKSKNDKAWAKQMFRLSLVVVTAVSIVIAIH